MTAPAYAQPVTLRTSDGPVSDARLGGIDFSLDDNDRRLASMAMDRVRREIAKRNRADLARELGVALERAA